MKTGSFLRSALLAGATCLALSAASITHAGILTSSTLSGEGVTINVNGSGTGTVAGAFTGTFDNQLGGGPVGIIFWCIDLFKHVSYPPFSYTGYTANSFLTSPPALPFDATRQLNLARLFTNEFSNALTDAQHSAAFQIAIWDILFDNDIGISNTSISTYGGAGQFGISSGNAATIALAQSWVNNLGSGTPQYPLTQLTSREHQDFITPGVPGLLPEPSPLPLLGAGLAVMIFAMRRRKAG
jgi:hypothetical protein